MKTQHIGILSILLLITACGSDTSAVIVEPTVSDTPVSESVAIKTVVPTVETKNEIVLLDFAISPNGKELAVYLNAGVYLYDIATKKRTVFYEFESDEYYSELNAGATIYPPFGAPGALAYSPDGSKIAISSKFQDEYIFVWDLSTHEIVDYIANFPNGNYARELEYSPSGETLLIRSTYPHSRLQCPEQGNPPEDTLSLILLSPRKNLFEKKGCNSLSSVEFHFSENNTIYFFHFGASPFYYMDKVNTQTGDVLTSEEIDIRSKGRINDVSLSGKSFAINGINNFLGDENKFLVFVPEIEPHGQLQLKTNDNLICTYDGLEYYEMYTKISRDNLTIASLAFNERTFQNSIQIWDIPSCTLIKTIPLG